MPLKTNPFQQLLKHFIGRFFSNDSFSPKENMAHSLSQALALVAGPGILVGFMLMVKYFYLHIMVPGLIPAESWSDRCFFVTYALAVTGIVTTLQWDQLTLNRRDYLILSPLPLRPRVIFLACLLAQLLILFLFYLAANSAAILLFPVALSMGSNQLSVGGMMTAQLAATFTASAMVFFAVVTIRGTLPSLLGVRLFHRLGAFLQVILIFAFAMLLLMHSQSAWSLYDSAGTATGLPSWLAPPLWFAGLFERLQGSVDPLHAQLARIALRSLLAAAAGFCLMTGLSFHRYARGMGAAAFAPGGPAVPGGARLARLLDRFCVRQPLERASFYYVLFTAFRSRRQRLVITGAVALAFALTAARITAQAAAQPDLPLDAVLAVPLLFSFCLLLAFRHAASLPAEGNANWLFQITVGPERPLIWRGVRKALVLAAVMPTVLASLPWSCFRFGLAKALAAHLLILALALILLELLFLRFPKLPFTCPGIPGKANLKATWPLYLAGFYLYVHLLAVLTVWLVGRPAGYFAALVLAWAAWIWLARWRSLWLARRPAFIFNEDPEPVVQQLNLG